jgi:GrpB-like predicted nucleotidyltransferase (UPF0157 family)
MEINERVQIEEHNPEWFKQYESEKKRLCELLGEVILGIEHIGSTSIPGMWAKPIVDILIGVDSLPLEEFYINKLIEIGYEYLGEAGVSGRLYFRKRAPHKYNVHVTKIGSDIWNNNIVLRDYLCDNRDEALKYSAIKLKIISEGTNSLLEYSKKKSEYINEIIKKANEKK